MERLPFVGWADVASKTDLQNLGYRLESKIDQSALAILRKFSAFKDLMGSDFGAFTDEFHRDRQRAQGQTMCVLVAVIVSIAASIITSL